MRAEDKWDEIQDSDQAWEEFYKELFDPFGESDVWEYENDYDLFIEVHAAIERLQREKRGEQLTEEETGDRIREIIEEHPEITSRGYVFGYGAARLSIEEKSRGNHLVQGWLNYDAEGVTPEQDAEPGTLPVELRNAYERIAEQNQTPYLTIDQDEEYPNRIFEIEVPPDYDPKEYQTMVDALTTTAIEIERLHQGLIKFASEYSAE